MTQELQVKQEKTMVSREAERHGGLSSRDIILPRAIIVHDVDKPLPPGKVMNSLTEEEITGNFVPLFSYKSYVLFENNKAQWVSLDRLDPKVEEGLKWNEEETEMRDRKPRVTEIMNFVCVFNDDVSFPVMLGFKATSLKNGRKLNTLCLVNSGSQPIPGTGFVQYGKKRRYELVVDKKQGLKTYWVPNFRIPKDKEVSLVSDDMQPELSQLAVQYAQIVGGLSAESYTEETSSAESAQF